MNIVILEEIVGKLKSYMVVTLNKGDNLKLHSDNLGFPTVNVKMGEGPLTQWVMVKLIKANFFISVYRLPSPKEGSKRSALDVRKTRLLYCSGVSGFQMGENR